jgi:hypothetical protein
LKDLAEASADNRIHGHSIAYQAPDGLQARGSCWEEKSIHEAIRRGLRIEGRRLKIAWLPRKATLYLRSSVVDPLRAPSRMYLKSVHSKGSNFMTTEEVIASLNTVIENQKIIKENQEIIKANQEKLDALLANQETIQANQSQILANQSEIISLLSK